MSFFYLQIIFFLYTLITFTENEWSDLYMRKQVEELLHRLPNGGKDIALFVDHLFNALENQEAYHRAVVAANAVAGVKPDLTEESTHQEDVMEFKKLILRELEKTVLDFEHLGDKYWKKLYKDGVHIKEQH